MSRRVAMTAGFKWTSRKITAEDPADERPGLVDDAKPALSIKKPAGAAFIEQVALQLARDAPNRRALFDAWLAFAITKGGFNDQAPATRAAPAIAGDGVIALNAKLAFFPVMPAVFIDVVLFEIHPQSEGKRGWYAVSEDTCHRRLGNSVARGIVYACSPCRKTPHP